MKTIITSRRAGAVLTGLAIAVVPAALALPTFTPVGPPNTSVTGMSGDGSVLVGQQSNGKYSYRWTREDGLAFDPWIRLHARLGAEQLEVCPASLRVEGTREEWEAWAGMPFPADGRYVVPGALVPVEFAGGRGVYVEPNVWMRHRVRASNAL